MRSGSSRQQRKWMNGVLGLVASVAPIAAYADLTNPWPSRPPRESFANIYATGAPRFVAPFKRSTLADGLLFPQGAAALPPISVRKRVVVTPASQLSNRQARRKTPMTLALILMAQAQNQRNMMR